MKCSGRSNRQIDIEQSIRDIRIAKYILKFIHTWWLKIIIRKRIKISINTGVFSLLLLLYSVLINLVAPPYLKKLFTFHCSSYNRPLRSSENVSFNLLLL